MFRGFFIIGRGVVVKSTLFLFVIVFFFSSTAYSERVRLICKSPVDKTSKEKFERCRSSEYDTIFQFDFDTNDYSKENPKYEQTLLETCVDPFLSVVGTTYRLPFEVSSTTLTFQLKTNSQYDFLIPYDINRETLSLTGTKTKCEISKLKSKNKI